MLSVAKHPCAKRSRRSRVIPGRNQGLCSPCWMPFPSRGTIGMNHSESENYSVSSESAFATFDGFSTAGASG